mmetsp:Transcript_35062/g.88376  ORF Transcript_35062/g.88376 Transcript_35062/m.88376 type:complete len:229 (+) Transcript_35062:967-1653(+)
MRETKSNSQPASASDMGVSMNKWLSFVRLFTTMDFSSNSSSSSWVSASATLVTNFLSTCTRREVTGLVIFLRKSCLSCFSVSSASVASAMPTEMCRSKPVMASIGKRIATVNMLKQSCTVAPAKARRYSSLSPACAKLTIVFVTEVPMLAPMIMGIAFFTSMRPAAVMVMMMDVLVDEDWTSTVARMPIIKPATGLSKSSLFRKVAPAVFPPKILKALPMRPKEIMNM